MGVTLEPPRIRRCANHCDFCFVDGNPTGMRPPLYIRDDDYRLSFRYGNFATLTNLKPWDVERIVEYRLSPLYVSVHATDPTVRRWLLRNPEAPEIVPQLRSLVGQGIRFHTQVVLVPGANDGAELVRTLTDLFGLGEAILSVSVVPVALTEYSKRELVRERIGVVTGTAMGPLMPQVLADVAAVTGGRFELVVVENALFGRSVTTAGLLPAAAIEGALRERRDLDLSLVPAEAVNDDLVFIDEVSAADLAERLPMPVRLSYDFADALVERGTRNAERGTQVEGRSRHRARCVVPRSDFRVPRLEGQG